MKIFISALIMLITQLSVDAQDHQISLSVFSFTNYRFSSISNNSNESEQKIKYNNALPLLGYHHIGKNQVVHSVQYGYTRMNNSSSNSHKESTAINKYQSNNASRSATHAIRLGIGKENVWNKFLLSSMLYLPVQYTINDGFETKSSYFNTNTNSWTFQHRRYKEPNTLTTGLYLAQALYYPVCKQLYVGMELNLGLRTQIQKGILNETTIIDNGVAVLDITSSSNYKRTFSSLDFLPALSMKYQFGKKKQ